MEGATRRRRLGVVGVGVLLPAVVLALGYAWWAEPGPLGGDREGGGEVGLRQVHAGDVVVYGQVMLWNTGDAATRLTSVELLGDRTGVIVDEVLTAGPDRRHSFAVGRGPLTQSGPGVPLRAVSVTDVSPGGPEPGGRSVEVLIPVRVTDGGEHVFTGVRVTYRYHGRTYSFVDGNRLRLCPAECSS
jgi:hypothetical protein